MPTELNNTKPSEKKTEATINLLQQILRIDYINIIFAHESSPEKETLLNGPIF